MACSQLWKNPRPSPKPTPPTPYCLEKSVHWEEGRKLAFLPLPVLSLRFSLSDTACVTGKGSFSLCGRSPVGRVWAHRSVSRSHTHQHPIRVHLPDGHLHFVT